MPPPLAPCGPSFQPGADVALPCSSFAVNLSLTLSLSLSFPHLSASLMPLCSHVRGCLCHVVQRFTSARGTTPGAPPRPFLWTGRNVLMEVLHGLDFLGDFPALVEW